MKPSLLLTTVPGLEELLYEETREKLGYSPGGVFRRLSGRVEIFVKSIEDVNVVRSLLLAENARLIVEVGESVEEVVEGAREFIEALLEGAAAFAVNSERITKELGLTSPEIAARTGEKIVEITGKHVSLDFPDIVFYVEWVSGQYRFGLDLTGFRGLRDRPYRMYVHRSALNPVIAAAMCRLARGRGSIYDPFCGSGTIIAECLQQGVGELFCSDVDVGAIRGAKLNLSMLHASANVHLFASDAIHGVLGRGVDAVVTNPPFGIREKPVGGLGNVYGALLEMASALEAGVVIVLTSRRRLLLKMAEKHSYYPKYSIVLNEGGVKSWITLLEPA